MAETILERNNSKMPRLMFRFWLDAAKDEQLALADYCESLKSQRSFVSTIRKALGLFQSLHERRTDVLFTLFPWLEQWLETKAEQLAEQIASKKNSGSGDDSGGNIIDLAAQIARLETLLLQQASGGSGLLMLAKNAQLRALPAPRVSPDVEDTGMIRVTKLKGGSADITANFLKSISASAGVSFAPDPAPSGIKKLAVPSLAAPAFDDDDDMPLLMT